VSISDFLTQLARPEDIRRLRREIPGFEDNRERMAVVVQKGFDASDRYQKLRPWIFAGSLIGAATSGWAWWKRRAVKEAHPLYGTLTVGFSALAYLTRPGSPLVTEPGAPATPGGEPAPSPFLAYLDAERARMRQTDPRWADKVYDRLTRTDMLRPTWNSTPAYVQAILV
jgi:hypothetical protein